MINKLSMLFSLLNDQKLGEVLLIDVQETNENSFENNFVYSLLCMSYQSSIFKAEFCWKVENQVYIEAGSGVLVCNSTS